jgi:hypothetical protein
MPRDANPTAVDALPGTPLLWAAVFAVLSLVRIPFHEMWRDEMNVWVAAVDSTSLADLIHGMKYHAHGLVWPLSVYALVQLVPMPMAMQCLHVAIATGAAWLLFRFAPFQPWQKILVGFGYYVFFEYAVISRHYAWVVLLLFTALSFLTAPRPRYLPAAMALALLAQTTVYGLILAVALACAWAVALSAGRRKMARHELPSATLAAAFLLMSVAGAIAWLHPPADFLFLPAWHLRISATRLCETAGTLWRAFVPIPAPGLHFWNTNVLDGVPLLAAVIGATVASLATWRFRRNPAALTCWVIGAGGVLLFTYMKNIGAQRQWGQLFLSFLAASWLMGWDDCHGGLEGRRDRTSSVLSGWVCVILWIQCLAGLYASAMDLACPFSASKATAAYIRDNRLDDRLIVADMDHAAVPVVAYLDRPRVYYPRGKRARRLILWNVMRARPFTEDDFLKAVEAEAQRPHAPVLVLTSYPLKRTPGFLRPIASFAAGIVQDECYYLYRN